MSPDEPRLPELCPFCKYELEGLSYEGDCARCPECGVDLPKFVPEKEWPLRCSRCRANLTGQAVVEGRVRCPKCHRMKKWPALENKLAEVSRRTIIVILVPIVLAPLFIVFLMIVGFVYGFLSNMFV
jgi:hypothetical protein